MTAINSFSTFKYCGDKLTFLMASISRKGERERELKGKDEEVSVTSRLCCFQFQSGRDDTHSVAVKVVKASTQKNGQKHVQKLTTEYHHCILPVSRAMW